MSQPKNKHEDKNPIKLQKKIKSKHKRNYQTRR